MNCEQMIEARVATPNLTPFEVKVGRRTVRLDRITIGDREFRKVIRQTPSAFLYTDNFEKIADADTAKDVRVFDVRQLPEACWAGLVDPLEKLDGHATMDQYAALLREQTCQHALVIARTMALSIEPHVWCSAKPEERDLLALVPVDVFGRVQLTPTIKPVMQVREPVFPASPPKPSVPAPAVKEAAPASPGGSLFFGDPADVKSRDVLVFDFQEGGVLVRAWPKTDREVKRFYPLTPRQGAAFRLGLRHLFTYDRFIPHVDGIEEVLDVPAPPSVPEPRAVRTCTRLVASIEPHGLVLLALLFRAAHISARSAWLEGRGWVRYEAGGPAVPRQPHSCLAREGRKCLASFEPEARAA